jgi:predicted RNA-binding protein Jag
LLPRDEESALREVEEAIGFVVDRQEPVELAPHDARLRRLQHERAQQSGFSSESRGRDPFRRVVIYPTHEGTWQTTSGGF